MSPVALHQILHQIPVLYHIVSLKMYNIGEGNSILRFFSSLRAWVVGTYLRAYLERWEEVPADLKGWLTESEVSELRKS